MVKEFQLVFGGDILISTPDISLVIAKINSFAAEKKQNLYPNAQITIHFKKVSGSTIHIFVNEEQDEFLRLSCSDANEFISEYAKLNFEKPKKITLE
jgi:hypothetical protein